MKAQVFLSCGQNSKYREPEVIQEIKRKIESELEFECYVAVEQQSLRGLRENIFNRLTETDFFIFIDFKREKLDSASGHRGSLFANQELAIASFLDLHDEVLLLREKGVEPLDGMLSAIQGNIVPFSDRTTLADKLVALIKENCETGKWTDATRNALELGVYRDTKPVTDAQPFHLKVENLHSRKDARNCLTYLDEIENLGTEEKISRIQKWETTELKWAGTQLAAVRIAPRSSRIFDAFWLTQNDKTGVELKFFHSTAHSATDYFPHTVAPGRYRLTYLVVSDSFLPVRKSFEFGFEKDQTIQNALNAWLSADA